MGGLKTEISIWTQIVVPPQLKADPKLIRKEPMLFKLSCVLTIAHHDMQQQRKPEAVCHNTPGPGKQGLRTFSGQ